MSSDYFCSRHMDKGKRVSWKVGKGTNLFTLIGTVLTECYIHYCFHFVV